MAKGCTNNEYEEARLQRLEENKKRFEDLGITRISKNLNEIASSAKKSPHRIPKLRSKTTDVVEPRRSSRVRNPVSYREEVSIDLPPLRRRSRSRSRSSPSSWGSYIARPLDEIKEATEGQRVRALDAAEAIQSNLKSSNPSFIKSMVRSHVYSCFWLGLPSRFCEGHLPKTVHHMILEDESGSEYEAVYIGNRAGLSGGWRAFALEHKLDDGDALVFELVEPARFKVYIIRAFAESTEEDGEQIYEEEGNACETEAPKAGNNPESESNKGKRRKCAIIHEMNELASSQDNLPESNIDNEEKPNGVKPTKRTRFSQKKSQKKSKEEAQVEAEKPEAATTEHEFEANNAKKSKESIVQEMGDSSNTRQLLSENNLVKPRGAQRRKIGLKKVESAEEGIITEPKNPRKKPAPKLFRKRA